MSKLIQDSLFELIKNLSKSEKRYFKLKSNQHTLGDENNYIALFNYLDSKDEYKEEELRAHFAGEAFLNRFSITKKRLYDNILNALDQYHTNHSVEANLHKMLHSFDILYQKSLYDQSYKILRSAEKLAEKNDLHNILNEVYRKYKKLYETQNYQKLGSDHLEEIYLKDLANTDRIDLYNKLWNIKSRLFMDLNRKGAPRTNAEFGRYIELSNEVIKSVEGKHLFFEVNYLYFHILSASHFACQNYIECGINLENNIRLFEKENHKIQDYPHTYMSILTNALYVFEKLKEKLKVQEVYQKLTALKISFINNSNSDLKIKLFSSITSIEMNMLLKKGEIDKALVLVSSIDEFVSEYNEKLSFPRTAYLLYQSGIAHLTNKNFKEAQKSMNSILTHPLIDEKEDIVNFALLIDLLIHLELNKHEYLSYAVKNVRRTLVRRNRLFRYEGIFLSMISKIINVNDPFEHEILLRNVEVELKKLRSDEIEEQAFEYFDLQAWISHKLKSKPLSDVIREKYLTAS